MPQQKSFVQIVEEMIEAGHSLQTVVDNLQACGLSKADAEKLVGIMEKKTTPKAQQKLDELVRKKIVSVEAAKQITFERRTVSGRRREQAKWKQTFKLGDELVREFAPGKHLAFKQRWRKMAAARNQEEETRKQMMALFLEFEGRMLPYRAKSKLKKLLDLLQ